VTPVIRLLPGVSRPLTAAVAGYVALTALLPTAFVVATGVAVDAATAGTNGGPGLVPTLCVVGALFFLQQSVVPIGQALTDMLARRVMGSVFLRTMAATLTPSTVAHLEDPAIQDLVARSTTSGSIGPRAAVRGLVARWSRRVAALVSLLLVAHYRLWVALGLLSISIWQLRRHQRQHRNLFALFANRAECLRRANYLRDLALTPPAAQELRVLGLGKWAIERFREAFLGAMEPIWNDRRRGVVAAWPALPTFAATFLALGLVGRSAARGEFGVGMVFVYAQAVLGSMALADVDDNDLYVEEGQAVVDAAMSLEGALASEGAPAFRGGSGSLPVGDIVFEGVQFRYPGRAEPVLQDLWLTIPAGRSLAVVGENGAGKTTLVKILAGLCRPTAGRVTVGGVDLTDIDPALWQRQVAGVFQDYVRYPLSLADNIGFGAVERRNDAAGLAAAAAKAGILDEVQRLPQGWDTIVSREFPGGVDLSGGQWQRVALARALFAAAGGARILVLDEPTAHLDVRAEADFYDRFLALTRGWTTILVSHRFSTVRLADSIVVIDNGRVAESGTHEELARLGGRYARLFRLQAHRFGDGPDA
jgi:ABC-type multidrug transport system fused ATPase/permease subunit